MLHLRLHMLFWFLAFVQSYSHAKWTMTTEMHKKEEWKRDILIASVLNCYKGCVNSITCPLVVSTGVVDPMCFSWLNTHAHTVTHRLCDCKSCEWQVNLPSHPWKAMGFGWVCVLCSSVGRRLSSWYVLNLYLFLSVFSWHIWVGSCWCVSAHVTYTVRHALVRFSIQVNLLYDLNLMRMALLFAVSEAECSGKFTIGWKALREDC